MILPHVRRWWGLLDDLAERLGTVHRWVRGPGVFEVNEAGSLEEFHPNPTLEICLAGTLRLEKPDDRVDLRSGDALLISQGVWHRLAPVRAGSLRFSQGFLPRCSCLSFHDPDRQWCGRVAIQPSRRLMEAALAEPDAQARRGLVRDLLANLGREPVEEQLFNSQALWRMVELMWLRCRLGLTVDEMLAASGLSRTHAYRLFTAGYGVPPKAALELTRLQVAEGLLATGVPVAETAARCGFPSADTFRRAWRRRHGCAPSAGVSPAR